MQISSDYSVPAKTVKKVEGDGNNALTSMADVGNFIKLFVAQMENQDPMNPTDGNEFFSQTAQITQVEQLVAMNTKADKTQASLDALGRTLTSTYLGREVTANAIDANGKPTQLKGVVMDVSYGKDGKVTLGLASGDTVALTDVTNIGIYTGN